MSVSSSETRAASGAGKGVSTAPVVLLVGNPNVGKTTLFNRLTGQNARVGNYPGITVERLHGSLRVGEREDATPVELVDVPGTYSLAARSAEEEVALDAILGLRGHARPALCVVVVDAGQLARNLYLVLQLIELRVPLVVALNLIDEVKENPPDPRALSSWLGVTCVATSARKGTGMAELKDAIAKSLRAPRSGHATVSYPTTLVRDCEAVAKHLPEAWLTGVEERRRALALWALTSIDDDDELRDIPPALREACAAVRAAAEGTRDLDLEIVASRYALIDARLPGVFSRFVPHPEKPRFSDRIDKLLLHPVWGVLIFAVVMLAVFQSLFSWSDPLVHLIERGFAGLSSLVQAHAPAGVLRDLVTEGLLGGVGNVVVFLPQILLLFFFIGLLEDTGYMARVAFLMDRIMKALGLHGRAFVPMLSGFACAVPAIMATRTMERQRDRLLTMLVIPLMTCSARLPVYGLIIAALFSGRPRVGILSVPSALMLAMYMFSLATTLAAAAILGRTVVKGRRMPLLIELPPYRLPSLAATVRVMWSRAWDFLKNAGTIILGCTVALWILLSYPKPPAAPAPSSVVATETSPGGAEPAAPSPIAYSVAGRLGHAIEPALRPLGFDWKLGVGIIGAFAAREVFVSTLGLVYGLDDLDDEAVPLRDHLRNERGADGKPRYTPLTGLSLMIFFALSCQCMSTLAVVRRESRSWRWPLFMFAYMTVLAYVASLIVYQGGRLLGFS